MKTIYLVLARVMPMVVLWAAIALASTSAFAEDEAGPAFPGCPEGTEEKQLSIPAVGTSMRWCEKLGPIRGIRHGPSEKRRDGRLVESGAYKDGARDGAWTLRSGPHMVQEGEYRGDQRVGVWLTRGAEGREISRVDYGASGVAQATTSAIPGPPAAAVAPGIRVLRVDNSRSTPMELLLEPAGEALSIPAGSSVDLEASGQGASELVIESWDEGLTIRSQGGGALGARLGAEGSQGSEGAPPGPVGFE